MKKLSFLLLPLGLFLALTFFLLQGLYSDPRALDSMQTGKALPPMQLVDVMQPQTHYDNQLFTGEVTLLNVWGTWCVTCAVELPFLTQLREQGVRIVGLYYPLDDPDFAPFNLNQLQGEVRQTLGRLGNPYQLNLLDQNRQYSLDLGVTGAPETFLVDQQGVVRLHHVGDLNQRVWQEKFQPWMEKLHVAEKQG